MSDRIRDNPDLDGTLQNPELTDTQQELVNVISYFSKVGLIVSEHEAQYLVEKPDGLQTFLEELEKAKKESGNDDLPQDEYQELEKKYRYDKLRKPLGNATSILNMLLRHLSANPEFQEIVNQSQAEAIEIAKKLSSYKTIRERRKTDLL